MKHKRLAMFPVNPLLKFDLMVFGLAFATHIVAIAQNDPSEINYIPIGKEKLLLAGEEISRWWQLSIWIFVTSTVPGFGAMINYKGQEWPTVGQFFCTGFLLTFTAFSLVSVYEGLNLYNGSIIGGFIVAIMTGAIGMVVFMILKCGRWLLYKIR